MWPRSFRLQGSLIRGSVMLLLGTLVSLAVTPARAAMSAPEITLSCNGLARMAFDLKDLVNVVAQKRNPGPFQVAPTLPFGLPKLRFSHSTI